METREKKQYTSCRLGSFLISILAMDQKLISAAAIATTVVALCADELFRKRGVVGQENYFNDVCPWDVTRSCTEIEGRRLRKLSVVFYERMMIPGLQR
jgi:hypothetical protein